VGLQGTPLIVTEQGNQMPGYVPPADLREALDQMAGAGTP
jgi:thiol:disulfide interchange protein DsbC